MRRSCPSTRRWGWRLVRTTARGQLLPPTLGSIRLVCSTTSLFMKPRLRLHKYAKSTRWLWTSSARLIRGRSARTVLCLVITRSIVLKGSMIFRRSWGINVCFSGRFRPRREMCSSNTSKKMLKLIWPRKQDRGRRNCWGRWMKRSKIIGNFYQFITKNWYSKLKTTLLKWGGGWSRVLHWEDFMRVGADSTAGRKDVRWIYRNYSIQRR